MATPGHDTEDERLSLDMLVIAGEHARNAEIAFQQADEVPIHADDLRAVLQKQARIEGECAERASVLANGLASNKVYIVKEGDLVHELAKLMLKQRNEARGEDAKAWEGNIYEAQRFFARLKDIGVLR